jgi:hypothetical protein
MHRSRILNGTVRISPLRAALLAGLIFLLSSPAGQAREHRDGLAISGTPAGSVTSGQSYAFTPTTSDPRERRLTFAIANKPAWAAFSASNGQLSGTPVATNVGSYANIVIAVSDGLRTATLPAFSVQVTAATTTTAAPAPVLSGTPAASVAAGSAYTFQPRATDPSGQALAFSVQNKPSWATFSIASGLIDGTPTSAAAGTYANIIISASDGAASGALPAFSITVNAPPATSGSAVLSIVPPAQNTDGSTLTDLAGYRIYYGTSASALTQLTQITTTTQTSYTAATLAAGTWYFGATAYTTAGTESAMSALVTKTIP